MFHMKLSMLSDDVYQVVLELILIIPNATAVAHAYVLELSHAGIVILLPTTPLPGMRVKDSSQEPVPRLVTPKKLYRYSILPAASPTILPAFPQ